MPVMILKLVTDLFWYLAVLVPVIVSVPFAAGAVLTLIPCAYGIWLILNRKKRDFSGNCQDVFLFESKILAVVSLFELMILGPGRWQRQCGPFLFGFIVAGIFLLRVSRVSEQDQKKAGFLGWTGFSMLPVLAAALLLASGVVRKSVWFLISGLYQNLILPVILGILRLFLVALASAAPLFSGLFPGLSQIEAEMVVIDTETKVDFESFEGAKTPLLLKVAGIFLLILAVAGLCYLVYKRIAAADSPEDRRVPGEIHKSGLSAEGQRESGGRFHREKNVRYYYRKFLRLCRARGISLERSMTSEEIQRCALQYWSKEELSELRKLYCETRYGDVDDRGERRQKAKELYGKLKRESQG